MKVVFKKNVPNVGKVGDIKNVADGFARNFLFKNDFASPATQEAVKQAENKKKALEERSAKERSQTDELKKKLQSFKVKTSLKFGEGDTAFGSVSAQDISDLLSKKGFNVDSKHVNIEHNIKTLGEHKVKIDLGHGVHTEINVIVDKED